MEMNDFQTIAGISVSYYGINVKCLIIRIKEMTDKPSDSSVILSLY